MQSRDQVLDVMRRELPRLRRDYGVLRLSVFGSVARGDEGTRSDVDVIVDFDGPATFDRYMGVKFHLEDVLGRKVDLVTRKGIRAELAGRVEADSIHVS